MNVTYEVIVQAHGCPIADVCVEGRQEQKNLTVDKNP